jgi:hypothetical protein
VPLRSLPDSRASLAALFSHSPEFNGLANVEREKMNTETGPGIRFCDEYEWLMSEFLRTLSAWTQLRSFRHDSASASSAQPASVSSSLAQAELARSHGSYAAAWWALRLHSRSCLLCAETLRAVNGEVSRPFALRASRCC